ncbi:MAG: DUF393 domain-containing protein [Verrucomicrobia bacterium]|nr:MAG: DUF393 domain-containing protein [Verrucomicrobiota bacterium]
MKNISAWQFTIFRIIFGSYLVIHFAMLVPYASELFSRDGIISNPHLNPTAGLFPNPLALDLPGEFSTGFIVILAACSVLFTVGWMRPVMAVLLWFGWTALFHRNNLIGNPSIPYIGLLLLLCSLVPRGEPGSFRQKQNGSWAMPVWVFRTAWILLAAGYTFSGITKCFSASWIDGTALKYLLSNPLARPGFMLEMMRNVPSQILESLTYATLLLEVSFAPLALWRRSRPWVWLGMIFMHLGIVMLIDFADLSLGMLIVHAFTFDPEWIRPKAGKNSELFVFFDGECLMCNRFVRFIVKEDAAKCIRFATLQGSSGAALRNRLGKQEIWSLLVEIDGKTIEKSAAVLRVFSAFGGHWRLLAAFAYCVPRVVRDWIYDWVALRRHRWFARNNTCEIPSTELMARLPQSSPSAEKLNHL